MIWWDIFVPFFILLMSLFHIPLFSPPLLFPFHHLCISFIPHHILPTDMVFWLEIVLLSIVWVCSASLKLICPVCRIPARILYTEWISWIVEGKKGRIMWKVANCWWQSNFCFTKISDGSGNQSLNYEFVFAFICKLSNKIWDLLPQNERQVAKFHFQVTNRFMFFRF